MYCLKEHFKIKIIIKNEISSEIIELSKINNTNNNK